MENTVGDPLVSVIIPTYNYGKYILKAVNSCLQQTYGNLEVIVVDDGSTDNTRDVLDEVIRAITYVYQPNQGVSSARNRGLGAARGSYITFLDADDFLTPDSVERRLRILLANSDVDFVISTTLSQRSRDEVPSRHDKAAKTFFSDRLYEDLLCRRISFATCAVLMRIEAAKQFAFPPEIANGEDIVYFTKVFFGRKGCFLAEPTAVTFSHPDSLRHNVEEIKRQGIDFVTAILDDPYYQGALEYLRKDLTSNRHMELFRRYYLSGEMVRAREHFLEGVKTNPAKLFKIDYLVKFLRTFL